MPKTRPANPGQLRVRIKWYVSRKSNFLALSLTNSNCPDRTRIWRGLLLITDQIRVACDNAPFSARLHQTSARQLEGSRLRLPQALQATPLQRRRVLPRQVIQRTNRVS